MQEKLNCEMCLVDAFVYKCAQLSELSTKYLGNNSIKRILLHSHNVKISFNYLTRRDDSVSPLFVQR